MKRTCWSLFYYSASSWKLLNTQRTVVSSLYNLAWDQSKQSVHTALKRKISVEKPETVMLPGLTSRLEGLIPGEIGDCMPLLQLCYELALQMFTSAAFGRITELPVPCFSRVASGVDSTGSIRYTLVIFGKNLRFCTGCLHSCCMKGSGNTRHISHQRHLTWDIRMSLVKQMGVSFSHNRLETGSVVRLQKFPRVDVAGKIRQDSGLSASTSMVLLFPVHLKRHPIPWISVPCKSHRKVNKIAYFPTFSCSHEKSWEPNQPAKKVGESFHTDPMMCRSTDQKTPLIWAMA